MSKSYKVAKKTINMGEKKGQTLFSVRPYSYGTLTTEEVANQIAVESTATPADVKAVLDRYAYYVKENLKKGYDIELLGFGKLFIRFITGKAVEDENKANAKLVKSLVPAFRPSFTKLQNGTRLYNLIPDSIELVKYGEEKKDKTTGGETTGGETTGGETTGGGSGTEVGGPSKVFAMLCGIGPPGAERLFILISKFVYSIQRKKLRILSRDDPTL